MIILIIYSRVSKFKNWIQYEKYINFSLDLYRSEIRVFIIINNKKWWEYVDKYR